MYFAIATGVIVLTIVAYWMLLRTDLGKAKLVEEEKTNLLPGTPKKSISVSEIYQNLVRITKICAYPAAALIIDFWITLAVFPAVQQRGVSECSVSNLTVSAQSWYCQNIAGELYILIFCFLFFNVFDWVGRFLAGNFQLFKIDQGKSLIVFTLARVILAGLFFFTRRSGYDGLGFLGSDISFAVISALFATTNGYVSGLSFMYGPMLVDEADREICGSMMPVFLGVGLLLGAASSFVTVLFV